MSVKATKLDVEVVRSAAAGHWLEILPSVAGIASSLLDGKHHPCPKCGGKDRFRLIDAAAGAVICNQCFPTKNGDGFAAIMWAKGDNFPTALEKVAEYLGMGGPARNVASSLQPLTVTEPAIESVGPPGDPLGLLEFKEWRSDYAGFYCEKKAGVTEEAMKAAGAKSAAHGKKGKGSREVVFAFPSFAGLNDLTSPSAWHMVTANGIPFSRNGAKVCTVKGGKSGLVGLSALQRLQELRRDGQLDRVTVWKVEGINDLLALSSAIPEAEREFNIVLTTGAGTEGPKYIEALKGVLRVNVIGDCDEPGQKAADKWCATLCDEGVDARSIELPYPVTGSSGKDVRDYLCEGGSFESLKELPSKLVTSLEIGTELPLDGETEKSKRPPLDPEACLGALGLRVLDIDYDGAITVYSNYSNEATRVGNFGRIEIAALSSLVGPDALDVVQKLDEADRISTFTIGDVRVSLGLEVAEIKRRRLKPIRGTLRELAGKHVSPKPYIWEGYLRREETAVIVAPPKVGKTMFAYGLAVSVAANCSFLGRPVVEGCTPAGGKVLLLDSELDPSLIVYRLRVVAESYGIDWDMVADNIEVVSFRQSPRSIAELRPIVESYKDHGIDLVLLDAKYRFADPTAIENDNAAETRFQMTIAEYASILGAAMLQVHHTPKGPTGDRAKTDRGAGAGAQSRAVDTFLSLSTLSDRGVAVLSAATRSYGEPADVALQFAFPQWIIREDVDPASVKPAGRSDASKRERWQAEVERVRALLVSQAQEYCSINRLVELSKKDGQGAGMGHKKIDDALRELTKNGEVEQRDMQFSCNSTNGYRLSKASPTETADGLTDRAKDEGRLGPLTD